MATARRLQRVRDLIAHRQQGAVVLEDMADRWNAAALLRTCEGLGFGEVHLVFERERRFDPRSDKIASSSSAHRWLELHVHRATGPCLEALKRREHEIVCATAAEEGSESVFDAAFPNPRVALVLGNEKRGLSETALSLADRRLHIPMAGMIKSLNLSVSAALCLYSIAHWRQARGIEQFLLPAEDRQRLEERFLEPLLKREE